MRKIHCILHNDVFIRKHTRQYYMFYILTHSRMCIYRLVPPLGTTYHGGGMGWDVNVHVNLQKQLMLRTRGVGWGGMGWDVNVHVNLQKQLIGRGPQSCARLAAPVTRQKPELVSHVSGRGLQTPCSCSTNADDDDVIMMMMMDDDPNETCQFRDKISSRN